MRPAYQSIALLLVASVVSGCGTTSTSSPERFRSSDDSGSAREYDPQPDRGSYNRRLPPPPPPAPPASGVSYIKSVGFLSGFGKHRPLDRECGVPVCTGTSGDSCCAEEACGSDACCDSTECGSAVSGSCGSRRKWNPFDCFRGGNGFRLFGRRRCRDNEGCLTAWDDCGDVACDDSVCCDDSQSAVGCLRQHDDCVPADDGCADEGCTDWFSFGVEDPEAAVADRQPCLADRLDNPFFDDADDLPAAAPADEPDPEPAAEPDVEPAPVPAAPEPVPAPPQAILPSPFLGISAEQPVGAYFPSENGRPRTIVEPPQWRGSGNSGSTGTHHSVAVSNMATDDRTPTPPQIPIQLLIAPRQTPVR